MKKSAKLKRVSADEARKMPRRLTYIKRAETDVGAEAEEKTEDNSEDQAEAMEIDVGTNYNVLIRYNHF